MMSVGRRCPSVAHLTGTVQEGTVKWLRVFARMLTGSWGIAENRRTDQSSISLEPGQQWTRSLTINASPSSSIVAKKVTKCARHGMDMYFNMSNAHIYAVGIMLLQPFKVWLTRRNIQRSHIRIHISLTSARSFSRVSVQCNVCR